MKMQVKDLLPRAFAAICDEFVAHFIHAQNDGEFLDEARHFRHQRGVKALKVLVVGFWDDEDVDGRFWIDVLKCQKFLAFKHFFAGNFTRHDTLKYRLFSLFAHFSLLVLLNFTKL